MNPPVPEEKVLWRILPRTPEPDPNPVELLHARFLTQRFSRHFHHGYAFGVILGGAMNFRYLGSNVTASAGQINLVEPGEVHDGHSAIPQGWAYRMIYLPPEALLEASAEFSKPRLPSFGTGVLRDPELARLLLHAHQRLMDPLTPSLESGSLLLGLLSRIIERHGRETTAWKKRGQEPGAVSRAREYLRSHFSADPSLEDLGRAAGLSPFHLARVFQQTVGLPPHAYLLQLRLERARELLAGPRRLADLAQDAGFADQSHLTRAFKAHFGITPGAYRKILQNF